MPDSQQNVTNIPSNRVDFIDPKTGLVSREWYRFFLNLFNLAGAGGNQTSLDDLQVGPPPQPTSTSGGGGGSGTVTSVDMTVPTGLAVSGNPITTAGTLAVTYASGYAIPTTTSQTQWDTAYSERQQWDGGATNLVAATGRTSLGATTVGGNMFTLTNPSAVTFPRFNADNTVSTLDAASFRTAIGAGVGNGTVTSVAASGGTGISVTGSPITTSGTLTITNTAPDQTVVLNNGTGISVTGTYPNFTITNTSPSSGGTVTSVTGTSPVVSSGGTTPAISLASGYGDTQNPYASKTANYVLAAPNGSAGVPTFRAIVAADIPTLNQNTTGTASNVTGIVAIANGGTGASTRQNAMDALAGAVTSGQYLRGNGTDVVMSAIQAADVPTLNQNTTGTASNVTGTVAIANGGTGQTTASAAFNALSPVTSTGDLIIGNGTNSSTRLAIGTNGYVLTSNGTTATWAAAAGGSSNITTKGMWENAQAISTNYSITSGNSAMSSGPITVASGVTVTVPSGSRWVIV